jgi:hypothetical protein
MDISRTEETVLSGLSGAIPQSFICLAGKTIRKA